MVPNINREIVSKIVNAIVYARGGATFNDIVAAFPAPPAKPVARRWLRELVDAGLLDVNETVQPHLYYITPAANEYVDRPANPEPDNGSTPKTPSATPAPAPTPPNEPSLAEEVGEALAPLIDSAYAKVPTGTDSPVRKPSWDAIINLFPEQIRPLIRTLLPARQGAVYLSLGAVGVAMATLVRQHPWATIGGGLAVVAAVVAIARRRRPLQATAPTSAQPASDRPPDTSAAATLAPSSIPPLDRSTVLPLESSPVPPVDRSTVAPIDRSTVPQLDRSTVSPIDRSTVLPVDRRADTASRSSSDRSSGSSAATAIADASVRPIDRSTDAPLDRSTVPQLDRSTVPPIDRPTDPQFDRSTVAPLDSSSDPSTPPSTRVVSRRALGLTIAASLAVVAIVVALTWHFASVPPFSRSTASPLDRSTVSPIDRSTALPLDRPTVPPIDSSTDIASQTASARPPASSAATASAPSSVPPIDRSTVPPVDRPADASFGATDVQTAGGSAQTSTQAMERQGRDPADTAAQTASDRALGRSTATSSAPSSVTALDRSSAPPLDRSTETPSQTSPGNPASTTIADASVQPINRSTAPQFDSSTVAPINRSTVPPIDRATDISSQPASDRPSGNSAATAIADASVRPIDRSTVSPFTPSPVSPIDRSTVPPIDRSTDTASRSSSDRPSGNSAATAFADASVPPIDSSTALPIDRSTAPPLNRSIVPPIDRSTVPPLARSTDTASPASAAVQVLDASTLGAYVFAHGAWVPLPRNNAHVLQTTPQKLTALLGNFERWEDAAAGKSAAPAKREIAELVFDGSDEVPAAPTIDLVIAYVGPLATISFEQQRRFPELKSYPSMELVPMKTSANGARYAPLFSIAPGFMGFGPARVTDATVEQRAIPPYDGVAVHAATFLRCTTPLPAGRYALSCGPGTFELSIE